MLIYHVPIETRELVANPKQLIAIAKSTSAAPLYPKQ